MDEISIDAKSIDQIDISSKSKKILKSLFNAKSGQDVCDALSYVPCENLNHMRNMIDGILKYRSEKK